MKTRVEQLKQRYDGLCATVAGDYVFKCLCGFAEILDNSKNVHELDTDLVDIYMILGMKNGTTVQITGQITDIFITDHRNVIRLQTEDRKTRTMPNSTFIFSLNEVSTVQSLDIVAHQKRMEARFAEEEAAEKARQEATKKALHVVGAKK